MRLGKIILDKYLSFLHMEYDFKSEPVLVLGRNLTQTPQGSNGAGKSSMQSGIEYCLTATNSRGVNDKEIVMFGEDSARAQLFIHCDVRKKSLHIDWTINIKGSNKLVLKEKSFNEEWLNDDDFTGTKINPQKISFGNLPDGKKCLKNWYAMEADDLFNYFLLNDEKFTSFFKSTNKEKIELINRFSDASIVDGIENVDNTALQSDHDTLEREIYTLNGRLELTEETLSKELSRDLSIELDEKCESLESDIEDVETKILKQGKDICDFNSNIVVSNEDIKHSNSEITSHNKIIALDESKIVGELVKLASIDVEIKKAEKLVEDFVSTDWIKEKQSFVDSKKDNKEKKVPLKQVVKDREADEMKILKAIKAIDISLSGSIECPKCEHEWIEDEDLDGLELKKQKLEEFSFKIESAKDDCIERINKLDEAIVLSDDEISKVNDRMSLEMESLQKVRNALHSVQKTYDEKNEEIRLLEKTLDNTYRKYVKTEEGEIKESESYIFRRKRDIESSKGTIKNLKTEIELLNKSIKALSKDSNDNTIAEIRDSIKTITSNIESKGANLGEVADEIFNRNKWVDNFKRFKMHIANQSLESIEYHTNKFIHDVDGDFTVKLEGSKILANGNVKEEITATIDRNGRERTFKSFSKGEQGRLLFASICANRHMINNTHPYGGWDFLSIDEIFESISAGGIGDICEAAKQLDCCVMIITHVSIEDVDANVIVIEKVDGFSNIIED